MKISQRKNNISEESRTALKQFREKQILSNIKYHKIFIALLIIINIGLIGFIIFYKKKISELKKLSNQYSSKINSRDSTSSLTMSDIDKKFLNLFAQNPTVNSKISYIFDTGEEFSKVKDLVYSFSEKFHGIPPNLETRRTIFVYSSVFDSEGFDIFMERVCYYDNIFIAIRTDDDKKFGLYFEELIIPDENTREFKGNTTGIFLYSFENQKAYKFIGKKEQSMKITKKELLNFGDNEIIVKNEFYSNGCELNAPLKSFDLEGDDPKIFTGKIGKFNAIEIEIYCFIEY